MHSLHATTSLISDFAVWLKEWQSTGEKGSSLSRETFQCAIQTSTAIPSLVKYLLEEKEGLSFILLGKFNSDAIERRFGFDRQSAAGNYYLSVRQFLEAEKSMRIRCLVRHSKLALRNEKATSISSYQ